MFVPAIAKSLRTVHTSTAAHSRNNRDRTASELRSGDIFVQKHFSASRFHHSSHLSPFQNTFLMYDVVKGYNEKMDCCGIAIAARE